MSTQFSVAILAGGSSRRMGTDKALMDFGGLPLIARAIAAAVPVTDDPYIAHTPNSDCRSTQTLCPTRAPWPGS